MQQFTNVVVGLTLLLGSSHAVSSFGSLLNFVSSCDQEYLTVCNPLYSSLTLIHPVRGLSCLLQQQNNISNAQCLADISQHSFKLCAASAARECQYTLLDPGSETSNASAQFWNDELSPFTAAIDCLSAISVDAQIAQRTTIDESCFDWVNDTAVFECTDEFITYCSQKAQDITFNKIACLIENRQLFHSLCGAKLSSYPSNFVSESNDIQLQFAEVFYGLIANPNGDALPSPPPSRGRRMREDRPSEGRMVGVFIGIMLGIAVLTVLGFLLVRWRKKANKEGRDLCGGKKTGAVIEDEPPVTSIESATLR